MPESPAESKLAPRSPAISPIMPSSAPALRPLSSSSSNMSGTLHSPNSTLNGRTPSPPSNISQQLPPACGARQLSKLKRFLTTLIQFGSDISPEIGDRVRSLVLALVNNHLSIEEFHAKLQEATNFPLRPFVIPFLKANLPLLQRELLHCARMAKQTPQQYLAHHQHLVLDPQHSPLGIDPSPHDLSSNSNNNTTTQGEEDTNISCGKRKSPDRVKENGYNDTEPPAKRPSPATSTAPHFHSPPATHRDENSQDSRHYSGMSSRHEGPQSHPPSTRTFNRHIDHHIDRIEDEWRHVENMLHCIMDMVGRCRRALTALQEKAQHDREELASWMRRHGSGLDSNMKKRADMMADSLRHTEDRVNEVRRRAVYDFPEEAVNEVKRQAVAELQKAVAAAESKAAELVAAERSKMDTAIEKARKDTAEEVFARLNHQEESSESCWNCGRKAHETCSGCNIARYCGSFCQHKDWESHHRICVPRPPATEIRPLSNEQANESSEKETVESQRSVENSPTSHASNSPTTECPKPTVSPKEESDASERKSNASQ